MNIGEEKRTIIVEPIKNPVPRKEPTRPEPKRTPARREKEKVAS